MILVFPLKRLRRLYVIEARAAQTASDTGYKGRIAIYEVMPIGDEIKELILEGASASEIKKPLLKWV